MVVNRVRLVALISILSAILCLNTSVGAGPPTQPSTRPSLPDLKKALDQTQNSEKLAEEVALSQFHGTPEYRTAKSSSDALLTRLEEVRRNGQPREKLDASSAYVASLQKLKRMDAEALNLDGAVRDAKASVKRASDNVDARQKQVDQEAIEERWRIEHDPMNVAVGEGRIVVGMTEAQADRAFRSRPANHWSVHYAGSGGAIVSPASGAFASLPSTTVFKRSEDDLGNGSRRITFPRFRQEANGSEYVLDQLRVTIANGKVDAVFGQE